MMLSDADITIAVTVYDRRDFIQQAVLSALNQTHSVNVMVVEDCGPDRGLQDFVLERFGSRITYHRNPRRRGLFDNWNACIEYCPTPWLSILHDDDYLKENFVETMLALYAAAPGRGIYFGNYTVVNSNGDPVNLCRELAKQPWCEIDLRTLADINWLGFGGHLFSKECVQRLGGFRPGSVFCGDWEMWFKLCATFTGIYTTTPVVVARQYEDRRKGTSKVARSGRNHVANIVQRKRNYAWLKQAGLAQEVDVAALRAGEAAGVRLILLHGSGFSRRMFRYNAQLFLFFSPASRLQQLFRLMFQLGGVRLLRFLSEICGLCSRVRGRD